MATKLKPSRLKANIDPITWQFVTYEDETNFWYTSEWGAGIVVDPTLSEQSTNPVQNQAIAQSINSLSASLAEKADSSSVPVITATSNESSATNLNTLYLVTQ